MTQPIMHTVHELQQCTDVPSPWVGNELPVRTNCIVFVPISVVKPLLISTFTPTAVRPPTAFTVISSHTPGYYPPVQYQNCIHQLI